MRIETESVSQKYGNMPVLHDISFIADAGEVVALLGPNGSGKSTLIKTIADILPPASGRVLIDGTDASAIDPIDRAKLIGYVPQYFHYTPFTTVLDTVLIGRRPYMSWSVTDEDLAVVDKSLATMHVTDLAGRFVNELSGGQRQRVFIARTLAQQPAFYLFDEPTSSLDLRHQLETVATMHGQSGDAQRRQGVLLRNAGEGADRGCSPGCVRSICRNCRECTRKIHPLVCTVRCMTIVSGTNLFPAAY